MDFNCKLKGSILYEEHPLPDDYGILKAREALNKIHSIKKEYKPEFIQEMAEIREEESIRISNYEDLFDDE